MRKVTFYIDDLEYFRKAYNLTDEQMKNIFPDKDSFKIIYTVFGEGRYIDRSILTDYNGQKIDRNTLNGFQRGIILNDCLAYFEGGRYANNANEPCGVVRIVEENV